MPTVVRLRYLGDGPVLVAPLGREVKPEELVEFPGTVITETVEPGHEKPVPVPEDADYFLIESGNPPVVRSWPKSKWANETPVSSKKSKE